MSVYNDAVIFLNLYRMVCDYFGVILYSGVHMLIHVETRKEILERYQNAVSLPGIGSQHAVKQVSAFVFS